MTSRTTPRTRPLPRPKAVTPLPARAVEALRARVDESSAAAVARDLAVSDSLVARALRGEGVTPAIHRLLTLQLAPDGTVTARARPVASTSTHDTATDTATREASAA
mgnify:CR=1 FL=1